MSRTVARARSRPLRAGVTLIEVLVVVVVVGLLAALIVPAVQSAREASRRSQCAGNLRQLGLALAAYSGVYGSFPGGGNGRRYSIHAMRLPYLEQTPLYNGINFGVAVGDGEPGSPNSTTVMTSLGLFSCPSQVRIDRLKLGVTNYAGSMGVNRRDFIDNGAFGLRSQRYTTPADFTDGLSTTAMMSEWILSPIDRQVADHRGFVFDVEQQYGGTANLDRFADACAALDPATARVGTDDQGHNWAKAGYIYTLYNHVLNVNQDSCMVEGAVQQGGFTAGSRHPSGANTLFGDGHVSFGGDGRNREVWRAIGTRDGGEVIGTD